MNMHIKQAEESRIAAAIGVWDYEGGASSRDFEQHQYGRRIEADRSWSVYHVFTGIPARFGRDAMTGLSRIQATRGMLRLNLRSAEHHKARIELCSSMTSPKPADCGS